MPEEKTVFENNSFAAGIRRIILERAYQAHVGHIGSALSVAEIIAALYSTVLHIESPADPARDRFILSKGHAALALYAAFFLKGWISAETLHTYCADATLLGVHPERMLPGVEFGTGSLGMGISYGAGAALAAKIQAASRKVFVLISDAECNEGLTWEAAMFAAQHQLDNFHILIDLNGQQALGYTRDILDNASLRQRWQSFGWHVQDVDGHASTEIIRALQDCEKQPGQPHVILAHTIFGKGVSFMENQIKWHYWPLSDEEYRLALEEIKQIA